MRHETGFDEVPKINWDLLPRELWTELMQHGSMGVAWANALVNHFARRSSDAIAIALHNPKTACLVFEHVLYLDGAQDDGTIFSGVVIGGENPWEWRGGVSKHATHPPLREPPTYLQSVAAKVERFTEGSCTLVFESEYARDRAYEPGSDEVVVASLRNLPVVDEANTKWEQVHEFRSDREARDKYRRFVHWLDKEMVGRSENFIADEISERLEDYEWVLRKHGFSTVLGVISNVLHEKTLLASAAAGAGGAILGGELMAALAAIGLLAGKASVFVAQEALDLRNRVLTTNPEIAFVHEAQRKLA